MGREGAFDHEMDISFYMTLRLVQIFLFTLPLQFALNPVPGVDLHVSRIFSLLIFFSWLASGLARKKLTLPSSKISVYLVSFVFVSVFSFLWAEHGSIALRRATFFLSFLPLFFVFSSIIEEKKSEAVDILLKPFFFGAALVGIIGIIQVTLPILFGVSPLFHFWVSSILPFFLGTSFAAAVAEYPSLLVNIGGATVLRASAFFPDPHIFAYFMGIAFPIGVFFALKAEEVSQKCFFAVLSGLVLLSSLLSFSRGAYLGLAFGLISIPFLFSGFSVRKKLYAVIFLLLSVAIAFFPGNPIGKRFLSIFSFEEGSNQGRIAMWQVALEKISKQPVLGYGLGNYPFSVKSDVAPREPIYAHNLFLDIATETGIVGLMLFLFALISALLSLAKHYPMLAVSLIVYMGHSLVETPLYSVHIFPALLLLMAFGSTMYSHHVTKSDVSL